MGIMHAYIVVLMEGPCSTCMTVITSCLTTTWARLLHPNGDLSIRGTHTDAIMIGLWLDHHHGRDLRDGNFDGFYTYFGSDGFSYGSTSSNWVPMCSNARRAGLLCCISVGPGYNDTLIRPWNDRNTRSRNKGKYYEDMWRRAIRANPHSISVTSYNEWGEGTQIEPARSFHLRRHQRERTVHEPSNQQGISITAEQLRRGIDMEAIANSLEDLQSWEGVELYTTPFADQVIGNKAAGLRDDARPIVQTGGTIFGGSGYYISTKVQSHAVLMSNIMSFQSYLANPSKSCPRPASPASPASPDSPGSSLAAPTASGSIGKRPPMTVEAMKIRISELKKELISKSPHTPRTTQGIKRLPPGFKRVNAKNGRRGIVNGNRNHSHTSKVSNDLLVPTTVPLTPSVVHANANAALALLAQNSRALKRTRTEV